MDSESDLSAVHKSHDLWYPDGTVILRAEGTLYCVYGGFLCQHSAVFKDMFEACQSQETLEGRPVIPMFDPVDDVYHFLKAIYDAQCVLLRSLSASAECSFWNLESAPVRFLETRILHDVPSMMTVLRMMTKYQVKYFRQRTLETLLYAHCPSADLASYRRKDTVKPFSMHPATYIHIINGALAAAAPVLLPSALYHLVAICGEREILQGTPSADGSELRLLDAEDKLKALLGLRNLREALRMRVDKFLCYPTFEDLKDCARPLICRSIFSAKARQLDRARSLPTFRDEVPDGRIARLSCETCYAKWQSSREEGLKEVWEALPSFFDLPPWQELTKQSHWTD